tara:strand:- start:293 stop:679 length:387 start_codon:yes stop_codon:yes gene_type:complete
MERISFNFFLNKKKLFIFYGLINTIFTNLLLQILLIFLSTVFSTFISQIFNLNFGYYLYTKKVFKVRVIKKKQYLKYLIMHFLIWNINWFCIDIINKIGFSKNLAALLMLPFLAVISYLCQNYIIFKK